LSSWMEGTETRETGGGGGVGKKSERDGEGRTEGVACPGGGVKTVTYTGGKPLHGPGNITEGG